MKTYRLNNNTEIPIIGFGTYKIPLDKIDSSIHYAYDFGYRLFDTARMYKNEREVGKALKSFDRESFYLTSKLWPDSMILNKIEESLDNSLRDLQTDYLDLYLMHWPINQNISKNYETLNLKVWDELIKLMEKGKMKSIGVSNFTPKYLSPLLKSGVVPAVNQIEYHPGYLQKKTVDFSKENGIQVQAWSPLARGRVDDAKVLVDLSEKYQKSISQIILRFIIQTKVIPIPKATSEEHIKANIDVFNFSLTDKEIQEIENLPEMGHSGYTADSFTVVCSRPIF